MNFLKPAKHIKPLPENQIDDTYKRLRLQVFLGIFIGYAGYYLLRKNFFVSDAGIARARFYKSGTEVLHFLLFPSHMDLVSSLWVL